MAGYNNDIKKSNNAISSIKNGALPITSWTKDVILYNIKRNLPNNWYGEIMYDEFSKMTETELQKIFLKYNSWHHLDYNFKKVSFWKFDYKKLKNIIKEKKSN